MFLKRPPPPPPQKSHDVDSTKWVRFCLLLRWISLIWFILMSRNDKIKLRIHVYFKCFSSITVICDLRNAYVTNKTFISRVSSFLDILHIFISTNLQLLTSEQHVKSQLYNSSNFVGSKCRWKFGRLVKFSDISPKRSETPRHSVNSLCSNVGG